MPTETITLHAFCRDHGLPKTSVRRWLNDKGHSTTNGLSAAAVDAAIAQFCPTPTDAPNAVVTTYETGNHRGQLDLPSQPPSIDLGTYRGEDAALTSFESDDIDRFLGACDGFLEAVDADYAHQKAVTDQKEAAAAKVRAKVEQVKTASLEYKLRSEMLSLHNRGLDAEIQNGLSTLKKPLNGAG